MANQKQLISREQLDLYYLSGLTKKLVSSGKVPNLIGLLETIPDISLEVIKEKISDSEHTDEDFKPMRDTSLKAIGEEISNPQNTIEDLESWKSELENYVKSTLQIESVPLRLLLLKVEKELEEKTEGAPHSETVAEIERLENFLSL